MTTASHLLYFYRATELVTVKHGNDERAILRAAGVLLAERSSAQPTAGLLAVDGKSTVLRTLRDGRNETYAYLPYGYDTKLPSAMPPLGFNGETLLAQHLGYALGQGHRLFNPARMRFNTPDRLSPFAAGGLNVYCYCEGDPVNYVDPTGRMKRMVLPDGQTFMFNANMAREIKPKPASASPIGMMPSGTSSRGNGQGSTQVTSLLKPLKRSLSDSALLSSSARLEQPGARSPLSNTKSLASLAGLEQEYTASRNTFRSVPVPKQEQSQLVSDLHSEPTSRDSTPPTSPTGSPATVRRPEHFVQAALGVRGSGFYSRKHSPTEYRSTLRPQRPS
ncbi:RHS repeat-associated core domain-containing protein [Pseudomonas sp. MLB6B]